MVIEETSEREWGPSPGSNRGKPFKPEVATSDSGLKSYPQYRTEDIISAAEAQARWLERLAVDIREYNRKQEKEGSNDTEVMGNFGIEHVTAKKFEELQRREDIDIYRLFNPNYQED